MKAFTIHNFWQNILTPACRVQYSFALTGLQPVYFDHTYSDRTEAETVIQGAALVWVREVLEKFVRHKSQIITASPDTEKQKALIICENFISDIFAKSLSVKTISQRFLKGQIYFETILPNTNNPSHQSSLDNLNELIKFCKANGK